MIGFFNGVRKIYIANNLKKLRTDRDLEYKDIMQETGISVSTLKNIEEGLYKNNNIKTIVALSVFFKVSVHDFVYTEL